MTLVPVAVLDDDPEVRDRLAGQLGSRAEAMASLPALEGRLTGAPMVIVLGPSCANGARLTEITGVLQSHREVGTVLVTDQLTTELLQTALRAGVNDVLAAPVDAEQLELAVARVAEGLDVGVVPTAPEGGSGARSGREAELGQVITVFSTKGGAGKSVLVTDQLTTELLQTALRAGVNDVLAAPVDAEQLELAVARVAEGLDVSAVPTAPEGGSGASAGREAELGKVITVFSTKGGAGKSVLAANLAVLMARRAKDGRPVALVDADLQFGDVAVMLKLAPQHTIVDAVGSLDRLDQALLGQFLMRHEPSGLLILPAPLEPSFADQISAAEMVQIVRLLRTFCSAVVIDTPAYFNEVVLGLIEESDEVLLIAGMDIPNIKNVKIGLQTLRLLNIPMTKLHLVLNRANSKVKLDVSEVERTLQIKAECLIPSDVVVPQSVNKGIPVVLDSPKSCVAKAIDQLANMFTVDDAGSRRR